MSGLKLVGGSLFERRALQVGDRVNFEFDVVFVGVGGLEELSILVTLRSVDEFR